MASLSCLPPSLPFWFSSGALAFLGGADGGREGPLRGGLAAGPLRRVLEDAVGAVQWERRAQGRDTALFKVREGIHRGKREGGTHTDIRHTNVGLGQ